MKRRRVIIWAGTLGAAAVAGCNDEEAPPGDEDDIADLDDGDDVADEEPDDDIGDEEPDDDIEDEGDTDPDDGVADDEAEADDTADEENPQLRDVLNWEDSFAADFEFDEGTGNAVFHEGDFHATWTVDDETVEVYQIADETYTVMDDQCIIQQVDTPRDGVYEPEDDVEETRATDIITENGEEHYVFEVDGGTLYVSVDSGYPVRFEGDDGGIVTYHSWGDTDPISPPDMECVDPDEEDPS